MGLVEKGIPLQGTAELGDSAQETEQENQTLPASKEIV